MAVSAAAGENLHFIISMGTILCDVLINLFCNDISQTVQQSRNIVSRFIPYIVWFNIAVLWLVFKRMKTISTNLRNFEPIILFVGTLLVDVVINLFCSDISQEIQQQTSVVGRFLPYLVLLATALLWFVGKRVLETRSQVETRQPSALQTSTPHGIFQLNDSVWELHAPNSGIPEMDVVLFHGLAPSGDSKDSFWKTWLVRDTDQVVWPKEWLGKAYPDARILSISYYHTLAAAVAAASESQAAEVDQDLITRNLVKDIILAKHLHIGQNCPVILIGHSVGGIVIKDFLLHAANMKRVAVPPITSRVNTFLENVRGVFYYGDEPKLQELGEHIRSKNPALDRLLTRRLHINEEFLQRPKLHARSFAVLEGRKTKLMGFHQIAGEARSGQCVVNRSYAIDADNKYVDPTADHFGVCRPASKEAATYTILQQFIASALADVMIRRYAGLVLRRFLPGFGIGGE